MAADADSASSLLLLQCVILPLASFVSVGTNTLKDTSNALQIMFTRAPNCTAAQLKAGTDCCQDCLGMGDLHYNVMQGLSFVFSAVGVLAIGPMIDKFGNSVIVLSVTCCLAGTSLMSLGSCMSDSLVFLPLMFAGAAFFGLGFQSCVIARDCIIITWFSTKHLGLALGSTIAINRLSAFGVFCLAEKIRESVSLQVTLWMVAGVILASLMCAIGVSLLDMRGSRQIGTAETLQQQRKAFSIRDVKEFSLSFWMVIGVLTTRYAADQTLVNNLTEFVHEKFGLSKQLSSIAGGSMRYIGFVAGPVTGLLLSLAGHPTVFLSGVALLLLCSVAVVGFTNVHPMMSISAAGNLTVAQYVIGLAVTGSLVSKSLVGTALSTASCVASAAGFLLSLITGGILGAEGSLPLAVKLSRWQGVMAVNLLVLTASLAFAIVSLVLVQKEAKQKDVYERLSCGADTQVTDD